MKKLTITAIIWVALIFIVEMANSCLSNLLVTVSENEFPGSGGVSRFAYWLLLSLNSIIYLIVGIILRARIMSTSVAGLSAIAFGLTYFFLVELTGGSMFKFFISHGSMLDVFLTFGFLLSPLVFIPIGVYLMGFWREKKKVEKVQ